MGYGYAETFLIIFLTHPGVIIPTISAVGKASYIPPGILSPEIVDAIPPSGFPPLVSGMWQVLWVWILSLPGGKSAGFAWTMYVVYMVFLFLYMYLFLSMRFSQGV